MSVVSYVAILACLEFSDAGREGGHNREEVIGVVRKFRDYGGLRSTFFALTNLRTRLNPHQVQDLGSSRPWKNVVFRHNEMNGIRNDETDPWTYVYTYICTYPYMHICMYIY